jgi:SAM-dependent methyltransferase
MNSIFSEQANSWDTEYRILRARVISNKIKELIPLSYDKSIIDFGAGTGLIGLNFVDTIKDITFIEQSDEMRNVLENKIRKLNASVYKVFVDLKDRRLNKNSYDLIISSMVFHHIRDFKDTGKRLYELLKNNKELCIVDLMPDDGSFHENEKNFDGYNGFDPIWLSDQFKELGFIYKGHEVFFSDLRNNGKKEFRYSLFILILGKTR